MSTLFSGAAVQNTSVVYQFDTDPALSAAESNFNTLVQRVTATATSRRKTPLTGNPAAVADPDFGLRVHGRVRAEAWGPAGTGFPCAVSVPRAVVDRMSAGQALRARGALGCLSGEPSR